MTLVFCAGVECDVAAAADSTAGDAGTAKGAGTVSLSSYGEFSEEDRKLMEETGTKQEFQAEVRSSRHFTTDGFVNAPPCTGWASDGYHHQFALQ